MRRSVRVSVCLGVWVLGLLLLVGDRLSADDGVDGCSTVCQEQAYFLLSKSFRCVVYTDPVCTFCVPGGGRCLDFVGPGQPYCWGTDTTQVRAYKDASCPQLCNLNLNEACQSKAGLPPLSGPVDMTREICQTNPQPSVTGMSNVLSRRYNARDLSNQSSPGDRVP